MALYPINEKTKGSSTEMKPKHQRFLMISLCFALLAVAVFLVLNALRDNILYFYMPSDIKNKKLQAGQKIRLGGVVKKGSLARGPDLKVTFLITDHHSDIKVIYHGILPDLFREEQGIVATGYFVGDSFKATQILAKHDETYMPPDVAAALKEKGVYQGP